MSEDLSREDVHRAVDDLITELLEDAGISEPPVDAVALARHLGLVPGTERVQRGRARREPSPALELTEEQRQRDAALDLAGHLKNDLLGRLGIDPDGPRPMLGESLGRLFAERLLVPTPWLAAEARACGHDLLALKDRFRTASHEAIAWRLLDLEVPCVITVIDDERVTRRRSNAFSVGKDLSPAEAACLRQVRRSGQPCRTSEDGWSVRGWTIRRGEGRRELLRSVIEE